ncbi:MAG: winged helix-turn-helix transcriptional regulator [Candidatus Micrarchaeota archaeon]|nr:winged helix-turn-helix transcriptional regulator [Candidatus Micrarchaeota archaeon]
MDTQKKIVIAVTIISVFVFVVAFSSLYVQIEIATGNVCGCAIPVWLFIPLLSSIGLLIGTLIYYLLHGHEGIVSEKETAKGKDAMLAAAGMLPKDEALVLKILIEGNGKMTQSEIMKKSDHSKVKIHRILKRLAERGAISKTKDRKINIIELSPQLKKFI